MTAGPVFSVQDIPFSIFGSWLALSPVTALATHFDTAVNNMPPGTRRQPPMTSTRSRPFVSTLS